MIFYSVGTTFKLTSEKSLYKPCTILLGVISLMLRLEGIIQKNDAASKKVLGKFRVQCSPDQSAALRNLYTVLMDVDHDPAKLDVQIALHGLCVKLLNPSFTTEDVIGCPTDQLLFIISLSRQSFIHPAQLYAKCGFLQNVFQLILVQMARLHEAGHADYRPCPGSIGFDPSLDDVDLDTDLLEDEIGLDDQSLILRHGEGEGTIPSLQPELYTDTLTLQSREKSL